MNEQKRNMATINGFFYAIGMALEGLELAMSCGENTSHEMLELRHQINELKKELTWNIIQKYI